MGKGLNTAFQKMKEWKLKEPSINLDGNYVKVIIAHASLATPEETIIEFLNDNAIIKNRQARQLSGIKSEKVIKLFFINYVMKN